MIINLIVTAVAFIIGSKLLSGVELKDILQSVIVAIVVAVLDLTLGTFLKIVTLGILSLGIFTWLLNAILIQVADWFLPGFKVANFWWALALAALVSIVSGVLSSFLVWVKYKSFLAGKTPLVLRKGFIYPESSKSL